MPPNLRWSTPSRADDAMWLGLLAAIEATDGRGETYTPDDLDDEWASIWAHPETDAVFGWEGTELVAFGWLKAMPGEVEQHRVECWGGVHPERRGVGIGRELMAWQVARAGAIAATFDPALPTRIGLDALEQQHDLLALAAAAGFEPIRRFLEVVRPVSEPLAPVPTPDGVELVDWSASLDEDVRLAHAEAFAEHWGVEPRSPDAWRQWYTGHRGFRPDLSAVAVAAGAVAAFVLVSTYPHDWDHTPREAWVTTVGTRPAWRGRGIARWLLTDVLSRIAAAPDRFDRAILGVDDANPDALALYRTLAFVDERASLTLGRGPL
jgi:ribosomal protein S18 acetylase RimI-like enzyme